jgi:uncharacterized protein YbjT (DUF2867 family)
MRIFLAGATGAIGTRPVPLRVVDHHVVATTRRSDNVERIRALGAEPVVLDALDRGAVMRRSPRLAPTSSFIR